MVATIARIPVTSSIMLDLRRNHQAEVPLKGTGNYVLRQTLLLVAENGSMEFASIRKFVELGGADPQLVVEVQPVRFIQVDDLVPIATLRMQGRTRVEASYKCGLGVHDVVVLRHEQTAHYQAAVVANMTPVKLGSDQVRVFLERYDGAMQYPSDVLQNALQKGVDKTAREQLIARLGHYALGPAYESLTADRLWGYARILCQSVAHPVCPQATEDGWYVLNPQDPEYQRVYTFEEYPLETPPQGLYILYDPYGGSVVYREKPEGAVVIHFAA